MKIIGKNSLSQYAGYVFRAFFILATLSVLYQLTGFAVCWYNLDTGSNILSDFFATGTGFGGSSRQWNEMAGHLVQFRFFIPFTRQNLITGIFSSENIFSTLVSGFFISCFLYCCYRFFREISRDRVFTAGSLVWLKRFGLLNIIFPVFTTSLLVFTSNPGFPVHYPFVSFLFFGGLILFLVEFFKKGLELQQQSDLTI